MCVHYTPIDGSHPAAGTPAEQLEKMPCAHAGFYFRAETIPTLALLEQAAAKGLRLVLTGHSLGAAVANLCTLTALSAQKKAREAAANAACARRASSSAGAADEQVSSSGCFPQQQAKMSPFEAAAAAAAAAAEEAHHNHSWCSANSDRLVSPQAALVDIVCVAFASPHWANQSLADYIEDNDWGEVFVNVVVPGEAPGCEIAALSSCTQQQNLAISSTMAAAACRRPWHHASIVHPKSHLSAYLRHLNGPDHS
jgi:hypothetical protein